VYQLNTIGVFEKEQGYQYVFMRKGFRKTFAPIALAFAT